MLLPALKLPAVFAGPTLYVQWGLVLDWEGTSLLVRCIVSRMEGVHFLVLVVILSCF